MGQSPTDEPRAVQKPFPEEYPGPFRQPTAVRSGREARAPGTAAAILLRIHERAQRGEWEACVPVRHALALSDPFRRAHARPCP